jgi:hypothetical protein
VRTAAREIDRLDRRHVREVGIGERRCVRDPQRVRAGVADDGRIAAELRICEDEHVVVRAAVQCIRRGTTGDRVVATATIERVDTAITDQRIGAGAAVEDVGVRTTGQRVVIVRRGNIYRIREVGGVEREGRRSRADPDVIARILAAMALQPRAPPG